MKRGLFRLGLMLCCVAICLPAVPVKAETAQEESTLVYSRYGREAVFVSAKSVVLRARPEKDAHKLGKASRGQLLWRMEEDVEGSGWDKINYSGVIVYVPDSKLSAQDPTGTVTVTTNRKYYDSMTAISKKYDSDLKASTLKGMSEAEIIEKVGPIFTEDEKESGILASLSLAQFILESDYGRSELAQKANNCFGMKADLSGNDWEGSRWDGVSIYKKQTSEQENGSYVNIVADFRSYDSIRDSIADHSAYLAGAKDGSSLRYAGLVGCTDYKEAAQIVKDGGYATSDDYVKNISAIVKRWNLTKYD